MTCEWKDLIIASYEIDKKILEPYLPSHTDVDLYKGKAIISLVAFTFSRSKFFGFHVPFHQNFAQINFRFYAKSNIDGTKGVVFLKEFAPKPLIAFIGNKIYNEPYYYKSIKSIRKKKKDELSTTYMYKNLKAIAHSKLEKEDLVKGTLKHFIVDRYTAFIKNKKRKTVKYKINHKPWKTLKAHELFVDDRLLKLLPKKFKNMKHISTYLVDGSSVSVEKGKL